MCKYILSPATVFTTNTDMALLVCRVEVKHERTRMASFGAARVHMTLDVRGEHHASEIIDTLRTQYKDAGHISVDRP